MLNQSYSYGEEIKYFDEEIKYFDEENHLLYKFRFGSFPDSRDKYIINNYIDVYYNYSNSFRGGQGWVHMIKDDKIILKNDSSFFMSDKTIEYINKLIKLKAFI